jgi:hypothetical protein
VRTETLSEGFCSHSIRNDSVKLRRRLSHYASYRPVLDIAQCQLCVLYTINIKLQHPVSLGISDFAFRFFDVRVQRGLIFCRLPQIIHICMVFRIKLIVLPFYRVLSLQYI